MAGGKRGSRGVLPTKQQRRRRNVLISCGFLHGGHGREPRGKQTAAGGCGVVSQPNG